MCPVFGTTFHATPIAASSRSSSGSGSLSSPMRYQRGISSLRNNKRTDGLVSRPSHTAAFAQSQGVNERDDRSGVVLDPIGEVRRLVAVPMPEEVNQERTAPPQGRLDRGRHQFAGRGALPAMQPKQGGIVARDLDVAEECPIVGQVDRLHADPPRGALLPSARFMCRLPRQQLPCASPRRVCARVSATGSPSRRSWSTAAGTTPSPSARRRSNIGTSMTPSSPPPKAKSAPTQIFVPYAFYAARADLLAVQPDAGNSTPVIGSRGAGSYDQPAHRLSLARPGPLHPHGRDARQDLTARMPYVFGSRSRERILASRPRAPDPD